jgi:hypothetical protein
MHETFVSEFAPPDYQIEILKDRLQEQWRVIRELRAELNAITAPGRCCRCGDYPILDKPDVDEVQASGRARSKGQVVTRAMRAEAERQAAAAIDRLTEPELIALIERSFNDREDLRERCKDALRDGGRKALVFFRPYLIKALSAAPEQI